MEKYKVGVVVGSLRKDSLNRKLAQALVKCAPPEFTFTFISIGDLPLYNQDHDANPSEEVMRLKKEVAASQALLFVTPEYNRSIPGVLKNALDHASRPYGQSVWNGKPGAVLGISVGATGTALAQQHLRNILSYLNVPTLGQPELYIQAKEGLFNEDGTFGSASLGFFQKWMEAFVSWVKQHVN